MTWARDHVLPGVITWAITGGLVWLSHRKTRRHIDQVTAEQTRTLEGGSGEGGQP